MHGWICVIYSKACSFCCLVVFDWVRNCYIIIYIFRQDIWLFHMMWFRNMMWCICTSERRIAFLRICFSFMYAANVRPRQHWTKCQLPLPHPHWTSLCVCSSSTASWPAVPRPFVSHRCASCLISLTQKAGQFGTLSGRLRFRVVVHIRSTNPVFASRSVFSVYISLYIYIGVCSVFLGKMH